MEKRLRVLTKKIVGQPNPKEGKWSNVLVFEPEDERQERTRGQLFAVLDLTGSTALDLAQFGRLSLESLQNEYYASEETSPLKALEEAIHKAQHRLVGLVFGPEGAVADSALNYNFAAVVLWGTVLYLAKFGASGLYLHRDGVVRELGEARNEKVFSASGLVQDKDVVILGSSDFRRTFAVGELSELDKLESLVADLGKPSGISGLILRLELEAAPGEEEEVVIAPVVEKESRFKEFFSSLIPSRRREPASPRGEPASPRGEPASPRGEPASPRGEPEVFVEPEESGLRLQKKRRVPKSLVLILVPLFLAASALTIRKRQADFRAAETEQLVSQAEQTMADARQYIDLNNSRARELLFKAKKDFEAVGSVDGEVLGLSEKIEEIDALLDQVNKVKRVKPEMVEEATISFDPLSELDSLPKMLEAAVDVGTYFGNVYFLVPAENQILKSAVVEGGEYADPKYWVTTENPPLTDAVAMAIDGFIYVLKSDGSVLKFEKGELVSDFSLKELDKPLSGPQAIFTTVDSEHLYILDAGNRRIVLTDKNGFYQSQYVYGDGGEDILTNPEDLFVDEGVGAIYLLDGTKIYRIGM